MSQNIISQNKRMNFNEQEIIKGIIEDDIMVIRYLYRKLYPGIKRLVHSFRNLKLNPDDVFQEGLFKAIENVKGGKFNGKSTFGTYLNSICYRICLKELKIVHGNYPVNEDIQDDDYNQETSQDAIFFLLKIKEKMDSACRQIIDVRFGIGLELIPDEEQLGHHQNLKFEEIGKILGIEPDNARQRFKRCMEKLREMLFNNPAWNDLF